ncbi:MULTISPECIES: transglutaminase family protein [Ralstonia]|uniref:transglutaminase family protein n=1 Tax=Ralstonia TaxID=48736 RepID=UPI00203B92AB|nr:MULTISPECIES: transglutaminase family protein [unclassified Ralstonia]MCM3583372.1 transglutaminase family protein [Ralstonia pickettii]MDR9387015.1 transglutaminase family protein [Ralstonia sp. 11b]
MSIRVALNHVTHDRYDRLVELSPQVVRLRPSPHCRTPVHSYSMRAEPAEHFINWQQDAFANYQARLVFPHKTREGAHWVTGPWFFRDERMYLIPGDSPMGYRLPLDSLPWVSKSDYPYQHAHDPFAPPQRTAAYAG